MCWMENYNIDVMSLLIGVYWDLYKNCFRILSNWYDIFEEKSPLKIFNKIK